MKDYLLKFQQKIQRKNIGHKKKQIILVCHAESETKAHVVYQQIQTKQIIKPKHEALG